MEHQVYASRQGYRAVLECRVCAERTTVLEDRLEKVNDFLQAHKWCVAGLDGLTSATA